MTDRMSATFDFHAQALQLRAERQRVLASNIANADTPGFNARDFDFSKALAQATGTRQQASNAALPTTSLNTTRSGHMNLDGAASAGAPELMYRNADQASVDGNSVSMDRERASFADNSVRYEATLRFINGNIKTMLSAITGQ